MRIERALDFVRRHHRAVMATYHPSGRLQLSPVTVGVDDESRVVVSTRETAVKYRNVLRDPRVSFCVMTDAFFGDWVQLDARADVVRLPDAMQPLVDYYRSISGEHPDWAGYRAAMERDRRVILRCAIGRAGPDRRG